MKVHAGKALRMLPCVSEDTAHRNKGFTLIEFAFYKGGYLYLVFVHSYVRGLPKHTIYVSLTEQIRQQKIRRK